MKVYISADMEGVSGVVHFAQTDKDAKEYGRACKLMTDEVNAGIEGALSSGANEIVVNDAHGAMRNILIENLNPAAQLISGSPKPLSMLQGVDEGCDAAFFVGYHAQVGASLGALNHVFSRRVHRVSLNQRPVGELGLNAALAGHFGVPVVLVTGDRALTEEARAILGDVEVVAVKEAYGMQAARCLPPSRAQALIREAAARAVRKAAKPFVVASPIVLNVEFHQTVHAEMAELVPGSRRLDGRSVEFTGVDMLQVYRAWRAMVDLSILAE